ncbi:hypothetical protein PPYR_03165 [Photinus pyralis]|uniref:CRAL-TRIO domain-containing protein n=1 Tax=Photinus pyralis TaxID=7054 RepID=A0A5N4A216_PHOPY|nr:alpha-tocopherol transfer protein-like [Photinus pyralis]KAB0791365.1 hypothetical protein PPYR_03165 [Photinus pyralis]
MKIFDARDEYTKTKELRLEDVRALQEWVEKQPHMPSISESLLIAFFQSCYWSMEQTKAAIEKFVTWRAAWPDFYANLDPCLPNLQSTIDQQLVTISPMASKKGCRLFYYKPVIPDSDRFIVTELVKLTDMVLVKDVMENGPYGGLIMVCDLTDYNVGHMKKPRVTESRRFMKYLQDAIPVRLKAMHYAISGNFLEVLIPLAKPFMDRTFLGKLHFHDCYEALFRRIPQDEFPKEIGGKQPSHKELHDNMKRSLVENVDFKMGAAGPDRGRYQREHTCSVWALSPKNTRQNTLRKPPPANSGALIA